MPFKNQNTSSAASANRARRHNSANPLRASRQSVRPTNLNSLYTPLIMLSVTLFIDGCPANLFGPSIR